MTGRWQAHVGEDYAVVMAPGEVTDNATIRLSAGDAAFAFHLADLLNDNPPPRFRPLVILAALWIGFCLGLILGGMS